MDTDIEKKPNNEHTETHSETSEKVNTTDHSEHSDSSGNAVNPSEPAQERADIEETTHPTEDTAGSKSGDDGDTSRVVVDTVNAVDMEPALAPDIPSDPSQDITESAEPSSHTDDAGDQAGVPVATPETPGSTDIPADEKPAHPSGETTQDEPDTAGAYYETLAAKAEEVSLSGNWSHGAMEFENIRLKWDEGPDADPSLKSDLLKKITELQNQFFEKRKHHFDQINEKRDINLKRREELLARLEGIIEKKKWASMNEVASIQRKFEDIRLLPAEAQAQTERFQKCLDLFNEHKIEYLVKVRQKEEENLMLKLAILDKMDQMIAGLNPDDTHWKERDTQFEDLTEQWRRVGRVVKEKSDEVWEHFKKTRDHYFKLKFELDKSYRVELEKNLKIKTELCEKAEKLLTLDDLAVAAKEMNILHKRWKDTGPVLHEFSEPIWERFKTASDAFNEVKHNNIEQIRDQEQENYELKEALCLKAEELLKKEAVDNASEVIEGLFKEWNAIGPVPRRKNKKIWRRFKNSIDEFQQNRRKHYKTQRLEQKENLTKKKEIITKLNELAQSESSDESTLSAVKTLQEEFSSIGYVPIKFKDKIWNEYRQALDTVYKSARAAGNQPKRSKPETSQKNDPRYDTKSRQPALYKLKKECDELNQSILQYADSKTYIKPNKKGMVLIQEIQDKIDDAKAKLAEKMAELEELKKDL